MVLAAVLYSWNLSGSSLNSFYSSAIYSGTQNWKAWFFGSLDAGNFLTVDKPPFSLMVMGLSCRIFGFGTWQMMLPEVAAALGTIWILHASVKRYFGHVAAAIAALVLALTPITVAINRDNNPDTLLVLLMVAGAALGLRAVRTERLLPLIGSAVCFGFAFNTKLLQGYIALPAVFAVYLFASKLGWKKKVVQLALATVALAVSSFWWATVVSLVPASDRPYIGGSTDGTAWDLIMGYDGFGRVFGGEGNGGGGGGGGGTFAGTAGIGRMFNDILGGQISWLLPFSAIALIAGLTLVGRAPRTDPTRAALVLWGGWTLLHYVTFSMAQGTMHPYYTTALAPGIAALCGGGGVMLWRAFRGGDARWSWVLPAGLGVTGIWAIVVLRRASGWNTWLWPTIGVLMVLAIVGLFVFRSGNRGRLLTASVAAAIIAALAGPTAYAVTPAASGGTGGGMGGTNPTAGPSTGGRMGGPGGGGGRGGFGGGMRGGEGGPGGGTARGGTGTGSGRASGEMPGGGEAPGGMTPGGGGTGEVPQGGQQGGTSGSSPVAVRFLAAPAVRTVRPRAAPAVRAAASAAHGHGRHHVQRAHLVPGEAPGRRQVAARGVQFAERGPADPQHPQARHLHVGLHRFRQGDDPRQAQGAGEEGRVALHPARRRRDGRQQRPEHRDHRVGEEERDGGEGERVRQERVHGGEFELFVLLHLHLLHEQHVDDLPAGPVGREVTTPT